MRAAGFTVGAAMVTAFATAPAELETAARFGPFRLLPAQRLLLEAGKQIKIGNRALDILVALIRHAGHVVTKDELISHAWPRTIVEDTNLRIHIAALRRALGDGQVGTRYIVNAVGRGYSFVETVMWEDRPPIAGDSSRQASEYVFPSTLTRMVGRTGDVLALTNAMESRRLVTLVGSGGVGKSTLALAAASRLIDRYDDKARFIDLATIADPTLIANSFATVIGLAISTDNPLPDLVAFLRDKNMLLVIDNCEHVIAASAAVVESILRGAPNVWVLATSREPLGAEGEWQHRLDPLDTPPESDVATAAGAREYPAVQLFCERALSSSHLFEFTDGNAATIGHICRRLDGIPLAIELAAVRVGLLGVHNLAARLDSELLLVSSGRRTAMQRHHTVSATLDWSYELLNDHEKTILRRLSVFRAAFTLESAVVIAAQGDLDALAVRDGVLSLADKSLLAIDGSRDVVRYRFLHTTRAYGLEKLQGSDDATEIYRWHADYVKQLLDRAEIDWEKLARTEWLATYEYAIDDVRTALDWAFSAHGDPQLAAALTVASLPFGYQLALIDEFRERVERALSAIASLQPPLTLIESRLHLVLAEFNKNTNWIVSSHDPSDISANAVADRIGVARYQIAPVLQKAIGQIEGGEYGAARDTAERLRTLAHITADPLAKLLADRVTAQTNHFFGDHAAARCAAERVLNHPAKVIPLVYNHMPVDLQVSMRIVLARVLWMEGFFEQSTQMAEEVLQYAASDSPFALCQALALAACPIAFWLGDKAGVTRYVPMLLEQATRYRLHHWRAYGECYQQIAEPRARVSIKETADSVPAATLRPARGLIGDTLLTIRKEPSDTDNLVTSSISTEGWCAPELFRLRGDRILKAAAHDAFVGAENMYRKAIRLADGQKSLAWKLRATTSLATLWRMQNRLSEARALLTDVCTQFTEGHGTRDLVNAQAELDVIG